MSTDQINSETWRQSVGLVDRPSDAELDAMDFARDLEPIFRQRKDLWEEIKAQLTQDEQEKIASSINYIDARFAECDAFVSNPPAAMEHFMSSAYYYCAHYPDMMVICQMDEARALLGAAIPS